MFMLIFSTQDLSVCVCVCVCACMRALSLVQRFVTLWTVAH